MGTSDHYQAIIVGSGQGGGPLSALAGCRASDGAGRA